MNTTKKTLPAAKASAPNPQAKTMKTSSPALAPNAIAPGSAAPAQAPNNANSNRPALSSSVGQKTQPAKPAVSKIMDPVVNNPMPTLPLQKDAVKAKKEDVDATASKYVPHRFQWRQGGTNVVVTGTFDDWQQSIKLKRTRGEHFEATVDLDRSKTILFKFVVDGQWHCSDEFATEADHSGNQNNILPPIKA
ncbi:hypothetical protein BGZ70_000964 [Mortierella alpina]|uniref:AMP-activated protein kinase glycogen-binding domain-containing protein n=1 Tax=Mortierella alpina TaxID=64518 RepID=A0A9P6JH94_MORAP|nr:hypothetical protein BGZ70_000964 [Mortierella alpina]